MPPREPTIRPGLVRDPAHSADSRRGTPALRSGRTVISGGRSGRIILVFPHLVMILLVVVEIFIPVFVIAILVSLVRLLL
jgi:hypothetical protein